MDNKCLRCGKDLEMRDMRQKYCTRYCKERARAERTRGKYPGAAALVKCEVCGRRRARPGRRFCRVSCAEYAMEHAMEALKCDIEHMVMAILEGDDGQGRRIAELAAKDIDNQTGAWTIR